jgi:hypothetical protein
LAVLKGHAAGYAVPGHARLCLAYRGTPESRAEGKAPARRGALASNVLHVLLNRRSAQPLARPVDLHSKRRIWLGWPHPVLPYELGKCQKQQRLGSRCTQRRVKYAAPMGHRLKWIPLGQVHCTPAQRAGAASAATGSSLYPLPAPQAVAGFGGITDRARPPV